MRAFSFGPDDNDDYDDIRKNGMWYVEKQSGYHDILKRGYPRPKFKTTVLAELYSPYTPDFLHGWGSAIPFLVTPRVKRLFSENGLTGFRFSRVEIAKIATKGRRRKTPGHEPEDQIQKNRDVSAEVEVPKLHAVRVTGLFPVVPDFPSGRTPNGRYGSPYELERAETMPDLWCPSLNGRRMGIHVHCSERFKELVMSNGLSNIKFELFEDYMNNFRARIQRQLIKDGG